MSGVRATSLTRDFAASGPETARDGRNLWMDRLRSVAIVTVVAYHSVQMSPRCPALLSGAIHYGQYGVDLFFVLSGWLIGALFWREWRRFGNVALGRFWLRRWMRTMPPYMAALAVSWLAVRFERSEPFDIGYLGFVQNYYARMPFFLVSWSLCVEEHFYLLAPVLAVMLAICLPRRGLPAAAMILAVSGLAFRFQESGTIGWGFGYVVTATHLRLDGLVMGFAASHAYVFARAAYARIVEILWRLLPLFLVALAAVDYAGGVMRYVMLPFLVAILCVIIVTHASLQEPPREKSGVVDRCLGAVAAAAYSVYLTHAASLHLAVMLARRAEGSGVLVYWLSVGAIVPLLAACAYFALERPSIVLRDRYFPRRATSPAA